MEDLNVSDLISNFSNSNLVYFNKSVVSILLNMNKKTAKWFVDGVFIHKLKLPNNVNILFFFPIFFPFLFLFKF